MANLEDEKQLLIQDIKNKFLWGIWARYIIALLGAVLIYVAFISGAYLYLSLNLIIFVAFYNVVAHLIYALRKQYKLWQVAALGFIFQIFDVSAITFLIYITGWVESPYWFLYLVLIILSGFGMFSYYSLTVFLIAFFSAIFYLGLLWAAYLGILPIYGPGLTLSPEEMLRSISNKAVFTTVSFLLFSSTIYYFSILLNQHRAELSQKNRELLAALEKLKDIDRLKDEFVSNASHELRSPLSVVRENMSLIEDRVVGEINPKQKSLLETSRLNVDRLAKILDSLLDLAKIESRSLELHRKTLDLSQIAVKAIELLKNQARQKNISIKAELPTGVMAWIDPDQILRVFINLLDNAIKYTNENGEIQVGAGEGGKEVRGYVKDNGIGITQKDFPRIFERFVRLNNEKEALVKGSGLGLSICKGIIEMHGGKIWAESEIGKGTKFIFTLPKVEISER